MCGRYTLFTPEQELEIRSIIKEAEDRLRARNSKNVRAVLTLDDIRPTDLAPVLFPYEKRLVSAPARWGFTNYHDWENKKRAENGKAPLKPSPSFNARDDMVKKIPFWRDSYLKRRCIVPAAAFEEWYQEEPKEPGKRAKDKGIPFYFTMPDSKTLYIAGIWQNEIDVDTGEKWPHYSMITTDPSKSVEKIHDRMPLVIRPEEFDQWFYGDFDALLSRPHLELNMRTA